MINEWERDFTWYVGHGRFALQAGDMVRARYCFNMARRIVARVAELTKRG